MGGSYALDVLGRYNAVAREGSGRSTWALNDAGTVWEKGGFTGTEYAWYPDRGTEDAPLDIGWYGEYTAELSWGGDKGGSENMEELPTLVGCCTVGLYASNAGCVWAARVCKADEAESPGKPPPD